MFNYVTHFVHQKLNNLIYVPKRLSDSLFVFAVVAQLLCSVLFILGYHTRLAAQFLLAWLVPITFIVHDLWTIEGDPNLNPYLTYGFHRA